MDTGRGLGKGYGKVRAEIPTGLTSLHFWPCTVRYLTRKSTPGSTIIVERCCRVSSHGCFCVSALNKFYAICILDTPRRDVVNVSCSKVWNCTRTCGHRTCLQTWTCTCFLCVSWIF